MYNYESIFWSQGGVSFNLISPPKGPFLVNLKKANKTISFEIHRKCFKRMILEHWSRIILSHLTLSDIKSQIAIFIVFCFWWQIKHHFQSWSRIVFWSLNTGVFKICNTWWYQHYIVNFYKVSFDLQFIPSSLLAHSSHVQALPHLLWWDWYIHWCVLWILISERFHFTQRGCDSLIDNWKDILS